MQYTSSCDLLGKEIDCRNLILACEFFQLPYEQITELSFIYLKLVSAIFDSPFMIDWKINNRSASVKNVESRLQNIALPQQAWIGSFEAVLMTPSIRSVKTFHDKLRQFERTHLSHSLSPLVSSDYPEYWSRVFPNGRCESNQLLSSIQEIFDAPNRRLSTVHTSPDGAGVLTAIPYRNNTQQYYGSFYIQFSTFSLGDSLEEMAKRFESVLIDLSNEYRNVNGRVMLQPSGQWLGKSPAMHFFSGMPIFDGSHERYNCLENEWYPTYYVCGAEWSNVISTLAQNHFENKAMVSVGVESTLLAGGGLWVRSNRAICDYDVSDAVKIKRSIYPALYPGRFHIPIRVLFGPLRRNFDYIRHPRSNWAIIPIVDGEINIIGTDLVFQPIDDVE